jgi:mRNA-degrading endonuclease RelE of RelBE toxin-antitoxin system
VFSFTNTLSLQIVAPNRFSQIDDVRSPTAPAGLCPTTISSARKCPARIGRLRYFCPTSAIELTAVLEYNHHKAIMPNVTLEHGAAKQLGDLPKPLKARVVELIVRLAEWPEISGARPLRGNLAGKYRLRTGDYRLQFRVEGGQVVIERVGHRDGFYDEDEA